VIELIDKQKKVKKNEEIIENNSYCLYGNLDINAYISYNP
jgi:hypothetical protein